MRRETMFRILVVDDEQIVLESVSQMIRTRFEEVQIETAKNAREGLIKMEQFRPNIIMTDIRMPGMNGIEFIERIRRLDKRVKIIIVSAFDHFEFAKEAVKFDVEDYLLKPLTKSKLISVLEATVDKVDSEEELRHKELDNIERFYQSVGIVESNFFNSILLNRNFMKHLAHYRELLEVDLNKGYFVSIEFSSLEFSASMDEMNTYNQKISDCSEYLKTHLKYQMQALVSNPFLNRIFIYVEALDETVDRYFWKQLHQQIIDKFGLRMRIGLGENKEIDKIYESYESAVLVLRQNDDAVASINEQEEDFGTELFDKASVELYEDFYTKRKRFKQALRHYEYEYIKLLKNHKLIAHAEAGLIEDFVLILDVCKKNNLIPKTEWNKRYLVELLNKTAVAKVQYFERILKEMFELYSRTTKGQYNPITIAALEKIQKTYKTEITLESLAEAINVTPQYLSKIIKEDTGVTFKEYLNEQRIEEAKKLLKRGQMSIKDIGFEIGYNDTSYFIRTFKKYEGITPKDYQRVVK